jgi:LmbE family N-acetylglucosaminyl deacetylase
VIATPLLTALPRGAGVLAIGAHADDIEIGCGGTMLRLLAERADVTPTWVVLSARGERADEARASAAAFLGPECDVVVAEFRDGYLPYEGGAVKDLFEELKERLEPHLVLTHTRDDLHQDHRLVCELTWNTWRDHLVLEYEIPKVDGDLGRPNVFVGLTEEQLERKVSLLHEHFATQRGKHWFTPDLFRGLARIRGMEGRAPSGLAEAFLARKVAV